MSNASTPGAAIDTAKVQRRSLSLKTLDDVVAEARRIAAAEHAGNLRHLGNWTTGQIFGHVAAWMSYPFDGYPVSPPWFVRIVARLMKNSFLKKPLPPGFRIQGAPEGTYGVDKLSTQDGLTRLEAACRRLKQTAPEHPNPVFGPLTHEEWITLNVGHANLHFGFVTY